MSLSLILFVALLKLTWTLEHSDLGSCSETCKSTSEETNLNVTEPEKRFRFPCSCTASCSLYQDCCYDSHYRNKDWHLSPSLTLCVSLASKGRYRAVSRCPSDWTGSGDFCSESIGHLPPVTSKRTGVTYANVHCAMCHRDDEELTTWNVELRCCPDEDNTDDANEGRIFYRKGYFWSQAPGKKKCRCNFHSTNNDFGFLEGLELRPCQKRMETSRCSPSWEEQGTEGLCRAFLDPVFVGQKVYRNLHCAECNFERLQNVQCMPDVVSEKLSGGSKLDTIFQYCRKQRLRVCVYYLDSLSRGKGYVFSSLVNINEQACIPPPGRRCCEGEMYDFKRKRCRSTSRSK